MYMPHNYSTICSTCENVCVCPLYYSCGHANCMFCVFKKTSHDDIKTCTMCNEFDKKFDAVSPIYKLNIPECWKNYCSKFYENFLSTTLEIFNESIFNDCTQFHNMYQYTYVVIEFDVFYEDKNITVKRAYIGKYNNISLTENEAKITFDDCYILDVNNSYIYPTTPRNMIIKVKSSDNITIFVTKTI